MNGLYKKLKLFRGSIGEIARQSGLTYQSVECILKDGKWQNEEVVRIAHEVLAKRKAAFDAVWLEA